MWQRIAERVAWPHWTWPRSAGQHRHERGDLDALAYPLAGSRKCGVDGRHAIGVGAIADFLSMVLARHQVGPEHLLLREQRAMPTDDLRNRRLLLSESILSRIARWPLPAVNAVPE